MCCRFKPAKVNAIFTAGILPSLLPGHYAIIKGREEGRGKANGGCQVTVLR